MNEAKWQIGDGWYNAATVDLEKYVGWLAWIEGQISLVSTECAGKITTSFGRTTPKMKPRRLRSSPKNVSREVRPSLQSILAPRRSARVSKTFKLRLTSVHSTILTRSSRKRLNQDLTELGQKVSGIKQPLRRSIRIAQRQSWGKDGSSY